MGKKDIAVSKIAVEWLERNKALWKQSTYSKYYHIVNDIVVVTLPAITILHLSEKVIQSEVNKMLTQNRSASYVRDYVTVINAVLRYAADKGYSCKTKLHQNSRSGVAKRTYFDTMCQNSVKQSA